ncbi:hypothetical protein Tsubulata_033072 [Turnera subulata]|uniref:Uncharacterized protein n=1 Tax=Turnera subulata TaxID=218843 RepID=A0A9Q0G5B3_9ROSI|nr:hypothetical protein Tsubulata_033072 [Turnera subulata]
MATDIFFFPFMAPGHMIPTVDMAELFASLRPKGNHGHPPLNENIKELARKFLNAITKLQESFEMLLEETRPDFLVADMFFPWANDAATKFGILRLVFHGTSLFVLFVGKCIRQYETYKKVASDLKPFFSKSSKRNKDDKGASA